MVGPPNSKDCPRGAALRLAQSGALMHPARLALALLAASMFVACARTTRGGGSGDDDDNPPDDDSSTGDDDSTPGDDDDSTPVGDDDDTTPVGDDDDTTPVGDDDDTTPSTTTWSGALSGIVTLATFGDVPCTGSGTLTGTAAGVSGTLNCDLTLGLPCALTVSNQPLNGSATTVIPSCFPLTAELRLTMVGGDVEIDAYGAGTDTTFGNWLVDIEGTLEP